MMTEPERAFNQFEELEDQAIKEENREAELSILSRKTWFYVRKTDLKKAIKSAQDLQSKAEFYNSLHWEATAHGHLLEIYSISNLPEQAIEEFEKTINLLNQSDKSGDDLNNSKAITHIKVATVYSGEGNFGMAKKMLIKADKYISEIKNNERRRKIRFMNFSNLGVVNMELNLYDSAEYFVQKSLLLNNGKEDEFSLNQFRNYVLLGQINNKSKSHLEAYQYLKHAEGMAPRLTASLMEKDVLYEELAIAYQALDSIAQAAIYFNKNKDIKIELEKSKNSSLHKIIKDELLKEKNYSVYILIGASILLIISSFFIFKLYRKNKFLEKQEKEGEVFLKQNPSIQSIDVESFLRLTELAGKDEQAFNVAFHAQFPDFYEKLLAVNPKLVESEIKFCTFLKLKLSTKEIAQIQNIEPATVKNKKNRIRKRLNIPPDVELYYFFNKF
ncbi:helix-turn-helix domain-containing protein [Moheibacter sediminis]|nr:LuxR C-terminal-related transcriptional regulator [Moheibacter sediminis]